MNYLSSFCGNRDNHFNLIRMIAASSVLVSHSFPISSGRGTDEPLETFLGISLGGVAVYVFFGLSGFLIAQSYDRKKSLRAWFAARVLRLFPALIVVVLLTVFVLGVSVTTLSVADYFSSWRTISYIPRNITLYFLQYDLPGVFEHTVYPAAINGSLWTLRYEVTCYLGVLFLGLIGAFQATLRFVFFLTAFIALFLTVHLLDDAGRFPQFLHSLTELGLPFAIGVGFYFFRGKIVLHWSIVVFSIAVLVLVRDSVLFSSLFALWLVYTIFYLGYAPGKTLKKYNRLGDYSYGMYVYAFPVQQLIMYFLDDVTPYENMIIAFPITLLFAVLSWTLVEKPSLDARKFF